MPSPQTTYNLINFNFWRMSLEATPENNEISLNSQKMINQSRIQFPCI